MNLVAGAKRRLALQMQTKGEDVVLQWRVVTGGTVDATTGSVLGGTQAEMSETVRCFVHALDEGAKAKLERYGSVQKCDYMVDAPADIMIEGRDELFFVIRGEKCAQATIGELGQNKIAKQVEVSQGAELYRTFYLQRI